MAGAGAAPQLAQSPTLTLGATVQGLVLGTAAYMAPEQARGVAVDKRADIWAFGVVLYEMLTGRRLFEGELVTDVLASVLRSTVELEALPPETPGAIRHLLRRCLERNPRNRLHDIADARIVLEEVAAGRPEEPSGAPVAGASAPPRPVGPRWLPWVAVLVGAALGAAGWLRPERDASIGTRAAGVTRFVVPPPGEGEVIGYPAVAPDGRSMAFCFAAEREVTRLWLHSFESGESRVVPGSELAEQPFWSPDGRRLGFVSRGQLRTLELATGQIEALATAADPRGGAWTDDGEIVIAPTCCSELSVVPAAGGAVRALTPLDPAAGETSHRYPWALPGGESLLLTIPGGQREGIYRYSRSASRLEKLLPQTARAVYDSRGFLLWTREGSLVARRFDASSGTFSGDTLLVAKAVGSDPDKTAQDLFGAAGGAVAVRPARTLRRELRWLDRTGEMGEIVASDGHYYDPTFSPDRRRIAVAMSPTPNYFDSDVWILDLGRPDRATRLTFTGAAASPVWSSDGESVYYMSDEGGQFRFLAKRADGGGQEDVLLQSAAGVWMDDASRGERRVSLEGTTSEGTYKLWLYSLAGGGGLQPFQHASAGSQTHSTFSPDGRFLAYTSDESGVPQVYVQPVDGSSGRWQVSRDGGDLATWRADGGEIYYVGFDRVLRAVAVRSVAPFAIGDEQTLFPLRIPPLAITSQHSYYLPSADGRRFLVNQTAGEADDPGIHVTLGWSPSAAGGERP
jgi:Tol biopolymer transport system component